MIASRRIAAIAAALCLAGPALAQQVPIGVGAPLSGPDAIFGKQVRLGVEQAAADINAGGGILGRKVQVIPGDDGNDVKKGVAVANGFARDKVPFVVGHFSSAVTVPASTIYADAGMVDITPSTIAPLVTDRGLPTVFRTCGREDQQADTAARYLLARAPVKVAILHDRTSTGKALADAVRKALAAGGVKDVFYGSLEKGTRDYPGLVQRIKASGAQIAFWGGTQTEAGLLIRQLRDAGARVTLMGGMGIASDEFATLAGAAADGTLMVFPRDPRQQPAAADLLRRLKAKGLDPDGYTFYAYAAVQVLKQAAEAAKSLDPSSVAATMHAGTTFRTVLGDLAFDEKGDPTTSDLTVYAWHKGPSGRMVYNDPAST